MNRWVFGLVWILWAGLAAAGGQESSKLIAMENAWNRAELQNDGVAISLLLADDFVMTTAEGTLYNKQEMVKSAMDRTYRPQALQSTNMMVHPYGNTAIVIGDYYEKGIDKGKPWERRGRFTDTWMILAGRWQCVASHFSVKPK
jgi:ketosteroid isomerase-like protein